MTVHTIGHSTRTFDDFLALLRCHGIAAVADVRRFPGSRRHPHFSSDALSASLAREGLGYVWLEALGGRRHGRPDSPHGAWRNAAFRAYADHMDGAEFRAGLDALLRLAAERPIAVMCAEAVPWRCHRQLIADALTARGVEVRHVTGPGAADVHRLTSFARLDGTCVVYDGGQPALASRARRDPP